MSSRIVDLRQEPSGRVQTAAFYAVRDLGPGEAVSLLTAADPALMMASLNLQLRDALAWEVERDAAAWRTTVRRRAETPPSGVIDLLVRDHRRLDELLAVALRRMNAQDLAGARPLLAAFAAGIGRHVSVENDLLAPRLPPVVAADGTDHVGIMRGEHDEIIAQLGQVEAALGESAAEAWEVEPFVAILSGTLAKHEHREEANLFPRWQGALDALPPEAARALLAEVQRALTGG
ncbi:MAG TPA: hemerythrin domain-containing protein [Burkholderiales bacterium]|nr:hemerythrin domain-containing protein [Burkholderiales bacterium]